MTEPRTATITVDVPRSILLTSNQQRRLNYYATARHVRDLNTLAGIAYRQSGSPSFERVHATAEVTYPNRSRNRDAHNLGPTFKALIDGFTRAGLLPDDNDRHLVGPDPRTTEGVTERPGVYRITFTFKELP